MSDKISIKTSKIALDKLKDNALLIGFFKDKPQLSNELKYLDNKLGNLISSYLKNNKFEGEKSELSNIYTNKDVKNVILLGLGEEGKFSLDVLSSSIADAAKRLRESGMETLSIYFDSFNNGKFKNEEAVEKIALSCSIGLYKFTKFKTKNSNHKNIKQITILADESFEKEVNYASAVADAVNKTRDFVNTPPNIATPERIANYAKDAAKKNGLKCTIFDEKHIENMKMGCFMGVAQGSVNKPRLVVLEYRGSNQKPIAIVGKGITFDSGGLNLKPYPYILNMKDDKGGALAAIHVIEACAKLKLPIHLIVIAPFCENMIDAASYRPDDVLTAYNGVTVEIKNTDAEGRLVLADALAYVAEMKPQVIFDIATLTGASLIALGYIGTPFTSTDEKLSEKIKNASRKSLEKVWELPLWQEYEENIKSDVADIKNISEDGDAGVIIGATFLKNFVNDIPWVHIDIGTTVWSKVDKGVLTKGATGATVRLMMELLRDWK